LGKESFEDLCIRKERFRPSGVKGEEGLLIYWRALSFVIEEELKVQAHEAGQLLLQRS